MLCPQSAGGASNLPICLIYGTYTLISTRATVCYSTFNTRSLHLINHHKGQTRYTALILTLTFEMFIATDQETSTHRNTGRSTLFKWPKPARPTRSRRHTSASLLGLSSSSSSDGGAAAAWFVPLDLYRKKRADRSHVSISYDIIH